MKLTIYLAIGLCLPTSLPADNWEAWDSVEGEGVVIDRSDEPLYEGEEYPFYHEREGAYRYETILHKDAEAIETYDPEKGLYKIYYHDEGSKPIREGYIPIIIQESDFIRRQSRVVGRTQTGPYS